MGEGQVPVVVITHNRCQDLHRTRTARKPFPKAPTVAVVDNGSSDGTFQIVHRSHPAVLLVPAGDNRPVPEGTEKGYQALEACQPTSKARRYLS